MKKKYYIITIAILTLTVFAFGGSKALQKANASDEMQTNVVKDTNNIKENATKENDTEIANPEKEIDPAGEIGLKVKKKSVILEDDDVVVVGTEYEKLTKKQYEKLKKRMKEMKKKDTK